MIERPDYLQHIQFEHQVHPVCAVLGPRQCGKTTLAQSYQKSSTSSSTFFDLEDPTDLAKFNTPKLTLGVRNKISR